MIDELYHYYSGGQNQRIANSELYHYSGGFSNIIYDDELYHYGVPGMKWGQRKAIARADRMGRKITRLENKQSDLMIRGGLQSRRARKVSRKLFLAKAKQQQMNAKASGDKGTQKIAKAKMKVAKIMNKRKYMNSLVIKDKDVARDVYGKELTNKQIRFANKQNKKDAGGWIKWEKTSSDKRTIRKGNKRLKRAIKKMNRITKKYS